MWEQCERSWSAGAEKGGVSVVSVGALNYTPIQYAHAHTNTHTRAVTHSAPSPHPTSVHIL